MTHEPMLVLNSSAKTVTPVDKSLILKYEFYILAEIKGQNALMTDHKKTLIVGCADPPST